METNQARDTKRVSTSTTRDRRQKEQHKEQEDYVGRQRDGAEQRHTGGSSSEELARICMKSQVF